MHRLLKKQFFYAYGNDNFGNLGLYDTSCLCDTKIARATTLSLKTIRQYVACFALVGFACPVYADVNMKDEVGTLKGKTGESIAYGISQDGKTIVGWAQSATSTQRAFRRSLSGEMEDLGSLRTEGSSQSTALGISGDGKVIVGTTNFKRTIKRIGGSDYTITPNKRAFRWTQSGGMQSLGTLHLVSQSSLKEDYYNGESEATATNKNGQVIVGWAKFSEVIKHKRDPSGRNLTNSSNKRAFRWTQADGMQELGTFKAYTPSILMYRIHHKGESQANAVSDDGQVIVGWSNFEGTAKFTWGSFGKPSGAPSDVDYTADKRAFRWTQADEVRDSDGNLSKTGMHDLGTLNLIPEYVWEMSRFKGTREAYYKGQSEAKAVSGDGKVIVGWADDTNDKKRAFRWTQAKEVRDSNGKLTKTGMQDLGTLKSDGSGESQANAISKNGKVIAGWAESATSSQRAFRWSQAKEVRDSDGNITKSGMQDLGTLKSDNSGQSEATAIADDGRTIVGWAENDAGQKRTFVWRWTPTGDGSDGRGGMFDLKNIQSLVVDSARSQVLGAQVMGHSLVGTLSQEIDLLPSLTDPTSSSYAKIPYTNGVKVAFSYSGENQAEENPVPAVQKRFETGITYGRGNYNGQKYYSRTMHFAGFVRQADKHQNKAPIVVGGFLGEGSIKTNLSTFGFKGKIPSKGVYVRYGLENQAGLTVKAGYAMSKGNVRIVREATLANTERGEGQTTLKNQSYALSVGYGVDSGNYGIITPYAGLTHFKSSRKGYAEKSLAYPVSYTGYQVRLTSAKLGARGLFKASPNHAFSWDLGIQRDLWQKSRDSVASTTLPGLSSFVVKSPSRSTKYRPALGLGYEYGLQKDWQITTKMNANRSRYRSRINKIYTVGFKLSL